MMMRRRLALASLTLGALAAFATLPATIDAQAGARRQPSRDHYARLAALSPAASDAAVDGQRFPLDKWGDLYAWRLLKPYYVTAPAFRTLAPPANSSAQTRAELDYLLALQESRTDDEQKWADHLAGVYYHPLVTNPADPRFTANRDNLFFVGRGLGSWFSRPAMPKTTELLARVSHDAMIQMVELKLKYARPRPHHLEPRLRAMDAKIPHGSYPSGHSFLSYVNAEVLSRFAPQRRDVLMASALDMAWSRELLGVHYPSDSEAGRVLAGEFVRMLFEQADFRQAFDDARQEWPRSGSTY
jgi:acid phosphatase (class A)